MHLVVRALIILLSGQLLLDTPAVPSEPRELYHRAATALEARQLATATSLLKELTHVHSDSALAEVAAFHLAECYLLQASPLPALEVLCEWDDRIGGSPTAEQYEPGIKAKMRQLLSRILQSFPDDGPSRVIFAELLDPPSATPSRPLPAAVEMAIAVELANRCQRATDFAEAQRWLRRGIKTDTPADRPQLETKLHFELPLVWAEHAISSNEPRQAVEVLNAALTASQTAEQELALRFVLAEALFAAGQSSTAAEQFRWLADQASNHSEPPAWLAAVTLRRAELLVRARDISTARDLLLQAKSEQSDFALAYEFDYLLARCAVARIEFDEATELLQQVIVAAAGKEASARAAWLLGEVHFLQHHYPQAVAAYAHVARLDAFPQWQARALLQSAKCHELLGDAPAAWADYQRASELSQRHEITQEAAARMAVIESAAANLR